MLSVILNAMHACKLKDILLYCCCIVYILFTHTTNARHIRVVRQAKIRIANKTAHYFWLLCENEMNVIIKKALNISLVYKLVIKMCFSLIFSYDCVCTHESTVHTHTRSTFV